MLIKKRISKYSIGELGNLVTYIPTYLALQFSDKQSNDFSFFLESGNIYFKSLFLFTPIEARLPEASGLPAAKLLVTKK